MPGTYDRAYTVEEAINMIGDRDLLIPAIQRKFVWDTQQICALFDSLLRGYPINTFMFWSVTDSKVKSEHRFYGFLERYVERFEEDNQPVNTPGSFKNFSAVIDGQQRLNSLYIGLTGSYAEKKPRVHWPSAHDERKMPTKKLYLNLLNPKASNDEENDELLAFDFRFLSTTQLEAFEDNSAFHWFPVSEILTFPKMRQLAELLTISGKYLDDNDLPNSGFPLDTLNALYTAIRETKQIHNYKEESQEIDHVLNIFIRTNDGGEKLNKSALLMSITVANWQEDAREQVDSVVKNVRTAHDMGFDIDRDFVLKACLVLCDFDVRLKVDNFNKSKVEKIESDWEEIKDCIVETFQLIKSAGHSDYSLRAKNAAIPLAYYLFHKGRASDQPLYKTINNLSRHADERNTLIRWLNMSLLKTLYGRGSDGVLTKVRKTIKGNLNDELFPTQKIVASFQGSSRDLTFDSFFVDELLNTQIGQPNCLTILALLMPEIDFTRSLHVDHLHPKSEFTFSKLGQHEFLKDDQSLFYFFYDSDNWNGIANLHLLDGRINQSKQAEPLTTWLPQSQHQRSSLYIPEDVSLEFCDFQTFVRKRRALIKKQLMKLTNPDA